MSFYDIKDPIERDKKIEALIKLTEKIKKRNYDQRVGYAQQASELEENFQPILQGQEKIREEVVKQLQPLHKQLEAMVKREPDLVIKDDERVEHNDMLRKYVERLVGHDPNIDTTFGIRYEDHKLKIGNKEIQFDDHHLTIGGLTYNFTPGLWSLITEKVPGNYSNADLQEYKEILYNTSALHQGYNPNKKAKASGSKKWREILRNIWLQIKADEGNDSEENEKTLMENENEIAKDSSSGSGIASEFIRDGKMFLRKNGVCYSVKKTHGDGLYFHEHPPYLLPGINYDW
tara:strand:- start:19 stop:885 length:867 start_codon:yes stop_codon:yes gene_type:complete